MDHPNLNMRQRRWLDVVKDYNCDPLSPGEGQRGGQCSQLQGGRGSYQGFVFEDDNEYPTLKVDSSGSG